MQVCSERVGLRVDGIHHRRVVELLQDVARAHAPALAADGDVCGWVVVGLEDEVGVDVGGEVLCDELFLLAAWHDLERD